jgi:uncharacterized surface anchored protein
MLAGALLTAFGLAGVTAGTAFAWHDKITVEVEGCTPTLHAAGLEYQGEFANANYSIFSLPHVEGDEPVTTGTLESDQEGMATAHLDDLAPGDYVLEWFLVKQSNGMRLQDQGSIDFTVGDCAPPTPPGSAAPGASAVFSCETEKVEVTLDNLDGTAEADFTVTVGDDVQTKTVPAGEEEAVEVGPLQTGTYIVVVAETTTEFEKSFDVTVDCETETPSESPPTSASPAPPVNEEAPPPAATLPHTGAGFPIGLAAAFALFLLSMGGFLLTYRKGMLPVLRRRH